MSVRYEREEEFLASAFKRVGGGLRDVQRATGTEKARTMLAAQEALTSANGKSKVWFSSTPPPGVDHKVGDTWFDASNSNRINEWDGDDWVPVKLGENAIEDLAITNAKIANLDGGKIVAGSIDTLQLNAGAIDGMTITGAIIRTAASGARVQMDSGGIKAYDASGNVIATIASGAGGVAPGFSITIPGAGNVLIGNTGSGGPLLSVYGTGSPTRKAELLVNTLYSGLEVEHRAGVLRANIYDSGTGGGTAQITSNRKMNISSDIEIALQPGGGIVTYKGGELSTDVSVNLASIISLTSGTTIDGSSWLRKRNDGIVYGTLAFYRAAGFTSGATFATLAVGYRPDGGDQLPAVMWGAGAPGRAHFQMGGAANGVLIVWSPPASTQYVSAKVMYRAS